MNQDNVIEAQKRFQQNSPTRPTRAERLEAQVRTLARVPLEDRPLLAANLGTLAERLNPSSVGAGARAIVDRAGLHDKWAKRQRIFRYPGELADVALGNGDYEANGATFIALAKAAGELLAKSHDDAALKAARAEAVEDLLRGTSFFPRYEPTTAAEGSAKALMDEYAARIAESVERKTGLRELWQLLKNSPTKEALLDDNDAISEADRTSLVPQELAEDRWRAGTRTNLVPAYETAPDLSWAEPSIRIGHVARTVDAQIFMVPPDIAPLFEGTNAEGEPLAAACEWLKAIGCSELNAYGLPDMPYDPKRGFGWQPHRLSVIHHAALCLVPDRSGVPSLSLNMFGGHDGPVLVLADYEGSRLWLEQVVSSNGFGSGFQSWFVPDEGSFEIVRTPGWLKDKFPTGEYARRPIFGFLGPTWEPEDAADLELRRGWTDDQMFGEVLLGAGPRFYPSFVAPADMAVPCEPRSLAAALLRNVRHASNEDRIDRQLIAKAARTAEFGLGYFEGLFRQYRMALRDI